MQYTADQPVIVPVQLDTPVKQKAKIWEGTPLSGKLVEKEVTISVVNKRVEAGEPFECDDKLKAALESAKIKLTEYNKTPDTIKK